MNRPRRRMLDPGLWANPELGELPLAARLLYIGLVSYADDEGRLRADPRQLRVWVYPYDRFSAEEVEEWLAALAAKGLVRLYQVEGERYAAHPNWERYQQISPSKRQGSLCPAPPAVSEAGIEAEAPAAGEAPAADVEGAAPEGMDLGAGARQVVPDGTESRTSAANGADPRQTAADGGERRPAAADGAEFRPKRREVKRREVPSLSVPCTQPPRACEEAQDRTDTGMTTPAGITEEAGIPQGEPSSMTEARASPSGNAVVQRERDLSTADTDMAETRWDGNDVDEVKGVAEEFIPDPAYSPNGFLRAWESAGLPLPRSVHWAEQEIALRRLHHEPPHWTRQDVEAAIDKLVTDHRGPRLLGWAWRYGPAYLVRRRQADEPQGIEKVMAWEPLPRTGGAATETVQERLARRRREREEKQHVQTDR